MKLYIIGNDRPSFLAMTILFQFSLLRNYLQLVCEQTNVTKPATSCHGMLSLSVKLSMRLHCFTCISCKCSCCASHDVQLGAKVFCSHTLGIGISAHCIGWKGKGWMITSQFKDECHTIWLKSKLFKSRGKCMAYAYYLLISHMKDIHHKCLQRVFAWYTVLL